VTRLTGVFVLATTLAGAGAAWGQAAGKIDPPVAVTAVTATRPLAEAIVGTWSGFMYCADRRRDFVRVEITFRFTDYGIAQYTRGPLDCGGLADSGGTMDANFLTFGDSIVLSQHGTGFPVVLVGVRVEGDGLEFAIGKEVAMGPLREGGFKLTRQ
jgi:hypothetical protein